MTDQAPSTGQADKSKRVWVRNVSITLIVCMIALVAVGWWLIGGKVWTDDNSIRIADGKANLRKVLWTPPKSLDDFEKKQDKQVEPDQAFNTKDHEYEPAISPDGTEMFFVRGLPGPTGKKNADIFISQRRNNRWSTPVQLDNVNSEFNDLGPRLTSDGEFLLFYSDREGGLGMFDIWAAKRTAEGFDEPFNLGPTVNSPHNEYNPAPSPDGKLLFFATNRIAAAKNPDGNRWGATIRHNPSATDYDLFVAQADHPEGENAATQIAFADAARLPIVNTDFHEGSCALTPGGDFLYFASNKPRDKHRNDFDLYRCRLRPAPAPNEDGELPDNVVAGLMFGEIEPLNDLNTPANETDPQLAMGGFRLYYSSDLVRNQQNETIQGYDLFVSESREVFADYGKRDLPSLHWSWWVLLGAMALLLLLMLLFKDIDSQKLSILQKCVLASIFLHLIMMILLSFVWLAKQVIEEIHEEPEPAMIVVNMDAAMEVDVVQSTREQSAQLPVNTPTMQPSARSANPMTINQPTPQQPDIQLPPSQTTPSPNSMVVPQTPRQVQTKSETPPTPRPKVSPTQTLTELALNPVKPIAQVQPAAMPNAQAPSTTQQAQTSPPQVQPEQVSQTQPTPVEVNVESMAQHAAAARAAATPEAVQSQAKLPTDPSTQPTPSKQYEVKQVKATQPTAPSVKDVAVNTPKRAVAKSESQAETSTVTAPTAKAAAKSMAAAAAIQSPSKPTAEQVNSTKAIDPGGAQPQASLTFNTQAVKSDSPEGPRVPENMKATAPIAATAPKGTAESTNVDAPTARADNQSVETGPQVTNARPTSELIEIEFSNPIDSPQVDTQQLTNGAKVQAESDTLPPKATDPSRTNVTRVTTNTAPAKHKPAEAGELTTTPTTAKQTNSLAENANVAQTAASPAERMAANVTTPSMIQPDFAQPKVNTDSIKVAQSSTKPTQTTDANAKTTQRTNAPTQERQLDVDQSLAKSDANPTQRSDSTAKSLIAKVSESKTSAGTTRTATPPTEPKFFSNAGSVDVKLPDAAQATRIATTGIAPPNAIEPEIGPSFAKSTNDAAEADTPRPDALPNSSATFSPTESRAKSLTTTQNIETLRPSTEIAASLTTNNITLQGLTGPLGPDKFKAPESLFQRAPERREILLKEFGGTPESEEAVARALRFLANNQEEDGRWTLVKHNDKGKGKRGRDRHDMALTSLGLLCFLADNHTPKKDGPYRETVRDAVDYLVKRQQPNGDLRGSGMMYDHGIATLALSEAAIMTGDPELRKAAIKGAEFIVKGQNDRDGGWRYSPKESGDTSVFGWQIMALHSCEHLGFEWPESTRKGADTWLKKVTKKNTLLAGYQNASIKHAMSAEAVLCRVLLGQQFDPKQVEGFNKYLLDRKPGNGSKDYYYWYYATLALGQMQGEAWQEWNKHTREYLIKKQMRKGRNDGAWPADSQWANRGGMIYSTAMGCLSLEVYYRYLPMYKGDKQD